MPRAPPERRPWAHVAGPARSVPPPPPPTARGCPPNGGRPRFRPSASRCGAGRRAARDRRSPSPGRATTSGCRGARRGLRPGRRSGRGAPGATTAPRPGRSTPVCGPGTRTARESAGPRPSGVRPGGPGKGASARRSRARPRVRRVGGWRGRSAPPPRGDSLSTSCDGRAATSAWQSPSAASESIRPDSPSLEGPPLVSTAPPRRTGPAADGTGTAGRHDGPRVAAPAPRAGKGDRPKTGPVLAPRNPHRRPPAAGEGR